MKRLFTLTLAVALTLSLVSCGAEENNGTSDTSDTSSQTTPQTEKDSTQGDYSSTSHSASEPTDISTFEVNPDLQVVTVFTYDNDTHIVVENTGDKPILNFRVAYISFDKNGFVATKDSGGYERGRADTVNIMPSDKYIAGWYGADGDYAIAAVIGIDYADGTSWDAESLQVDRWAATASKEFSVETYKENLTALKETGALAETNEYVALTDFNLKHGNQFSNDLDFHFSVTNTSDQGILKLQLFVLEFDENGFPVSVSPYDTYCINGHTTGGTINLVAGSSSSYTDDLFIQGNTTQVKAIVSYVEFQDGTEWNNPYLYEWVISNNGAY